MFARYFVELPIESSLVERALTGAPATWFRGLAGEANHRGDTLLADVGFGQHVRVARQVAIELGTPVHTSGKTVLPIRWTPTGAPGLFPALEADMEVAPLTSDRTQLAISARYVPPARTDRRRASIARSSTGSPRPRSRTSSTVSGRTGPGGRARSDAEAAFGRRRSMIVVKEPPLRVMLVDDHEVVRNGVRAMLQAEEDIVVTAEAGTVQEAIDEAERARPDVVVMDVRLADGSGIEATREIRARRPQTQVLMLTSFADDEALFASIMAGAAGYVLKQVKGGELVRAIRIVGKGESLLDPT